MICENCIHNSVCKYGEARSNGLYCTGEKCKQYQSANAVPKSEVASEIFEEIDAIFRKHFQDNKTKSVWEPYLLKEVKQVSRGTINNLWSDIAELKNKYTEEGK